MIVDGRRYSGWKSIRVTRSIESLAGSFALDVSDRWANQDEPWPIREEDPCQIAIDGTVVVDGFVDKRSQSISATSRALSYSGRDRAGSLVDCSAIVSGGATAGSKWTFYNVDVAQFTAAVAKPFGIRVSVQPGLKLPKVPVLALHPGETAYESIKRAAGDDGVLVVSDGAGGIVITRAGASRAAALLQGDNVLSASVEYDGAERFHRYIIATQVPGTDEAAGEATQIQGQALDLGVRRTERVLLIRPDKGYSAADARRRADWEARTRAARAEKVSVSVQGWYQRAGGALWTPNANTLVSIPSIGVNGNMVISQVEYSIGDGGQITQLSLVRPDAFAPEPKAATVATEGGWKELKNGAR
jgi:prophage tail gpP-like protein